METLNKSSDFSLPAVLNKSRGEDIQDLWEQVLEHDVLVVDGADVTNIDSQGLSLVLDGLRRARFEGKQVVKVSALVPGSLAKGEHALDLALTVQACDDKRCLAPADLPLQVSLKVE